MLIRRSTIAVAFLALSLTGCTDVERALNKGGDTTCADYLGSNADTQRMTVTKFVKQLNKLDTEPSGTWVDAGMVQVGLLCGIQGNREVQIKNANLGGIFAPPPRK